MVRDDAGERARPVLPPTVLDNRDPGRYNPPPMARMYPEEFRGESEAERALYRSLRDALDDRHLVFHRGAWLAPTAGADGEIDFVVAREDGGILAIDVWDAGAAFDARSGWQEVDFGGARRAMEDPLTRASRLRTALAARLRAMGRPCTVGHAAAFPLVRFQTERPEILLDQSDLPRLAAWIDRAFRQFAGPPGAEGIRALTSLLGRSFEIVPLIGSHIVRGEQEIARLTVQQFKVLDGLARSRRVLICGCAGSGKTMLALEKAKRLGEQGFRTLYVCYNRALRDSCREFLRDVRGVTVDHYHGLCHDWTARAKIPVEWRQDREFWRKILPRQFLEAVRQIEDRFDAIVVDEGQDFEASWWESVEMLLADRSRGVFYVFYDDNQVLYTDRLELPGGMLQFDLTENCRNTRKIHDLVYRFYRADRRITAQGPAGWKPEIATYRTEADLLRRVEEAVVRFTQTQKIPFQHIAVLTGHGKEKSAVWRARRFAGYELTEERIPKEGQLRWSTVHSFKGLEAAAVILSEIEPLGHAGLDTLLYVGCSRARLHLAVIASETASRDAGLTVP